MKKQKIAVLLMAHGAPESLDDIPAYLGHIMKGRPPSDEIITQIKDRYAEAGGRSPLLDITKIQAAQLEARLKSQDAEIKVYIGMRHWHPFINETVLEILQDKPDHLVAISLAPQYSVLSVGAYLQTLEKALSNHSTRPPILKVLSWCDTPKLIGAFSERIEQAYQQHQLDPGNVPLLFTAHSLPESIIETQDPYPKEVRATVDGVLKKLSSRGLQPKWHFAYQSQGFRGGKWLGPSVESTLGKLAETGAGKVLVAPIGFVSDHIEILYDIDILFKGLAASHGMKLFRIVSLNDSKRFTDALVDVVTDRLKTEGLHTDQPAERT